MVAFPARPSCGAGRGYRPPVRFPRRPLLAATLAVALLSACDGDGGDPGDVAEPSTATTDADPDDDPGADADVSPDAAGPAVPSLLPGEDGIDHWDETSVTLGDGTMEVAAKVADTAPRRQQGLMRVPALPDGVGMLFLFEQPSSGGFWMKDTLVPLDIAYLADGEVVQILQMEPCGEQDPCPTYPPGVTYDAALEVPQGAFADAGIEVGDPVRWTDPVPVDAAEST